MMEWIACIDVRKYRGISPCIRSGAVVLTDNQREHIIARRGQLFYDCYSPFFRETAEDPDYIFRDKAHENTAIASKTISTGEKHINLVIRLAVAGDREGLENSIITAIVENDRRYRQRVRNNFALYKKE